MLHVGGKSKLKQLKTLDWFGIFLFSTGLVVFLIGMNWGGGVYPWQSGHVLGALFAGFFTLVGFCFWEAYSGLQYPLIPMRLFKNIEYDAVVACASLGAVVYYASTYLSSCRYSARTKVLALYFSSWGNTEVPKRLSWRFISIGLLISS
jgi:hypothetical protein